jgi:hypothetical protein
MLSARIGGVCAANVKLLQALQGSQLPETLIRDGGAGEA